MKTNKPFAYGQEQSVTLTVNDTNKIYCINDVSDEIGAIYPSMSITCAASGDLTIYNAMEDCTMFIKNCSIGEVITIDGDTRIISSSYNSHDICNDFNYDFFRIGNTINDRVNKISISLPCVIQIKYSPIIKDSP